MRLYRESHEKVCSHFSVFTWICVHSLLMYMTISMLLAYIFEVWKEFRITRMLTKLISVALKMHSVNVIELVFQLSWLDEICKGFWHIFEDGSCHHNIHNL